MKRETSWNGGRCSTVWNHWFLTWGHTLGSLDLQSLLKTTPRNALRFSQFPLVRFYTYVYKGASCLASYPTSGHSYVCFGARSALDPVSSLLSLRVKRGRTSFDAATHPFRVIHTHTYTQTERSPVDFLVMEPHLGRYMKPLREFGFFIFVFHSWNIFICLTRPSIILKKTLKKKLIKEFCEKKIEKCFAERNFL